MFRRHAIERVLSIFIITAMILSGMLMHFFGATQEAYAANVGEKNKQACDNCNAVVNGTAPDGYTGIAGTEAGSGKFSVYSGGNSYSHAGGNLLDDGPTDFAKPLPYGDVYVDANKLNWDDPEGFILDIQDNRFKWVSVNEELTDATGTTKSTNDPMGTGPLSSGSMQAICYVGPLKSYLENITDAASAPGANTTTNVIEPTGSEDYLYRITYLNAVTLPDGTRGNLILTTRRMEIETSVTVDDLHPYKLTYTDDEGVVHNYQYTKAFLKVQGANQLSNDTGYNIRDAYGNEINQRFSQVMTAEQAAARRTEVNGYLPTGNSNQLGTAWAQAKNMRNATGNIIDLDIEVVDAEGNPVNGTISYAAHDMDFESVQNVWGRPAGYEFSEAMTVVSGAQSYALVPNYEYANAATREEGWVPSGPGEPANDRPIRIEKSGSGTNADGLRFAAPFLVNYRDANGKFDDVLFNNTEVTSFQGDTLAASNYVISKKVGPNTINTAASNAAKKQLYAKLKAKGYTGVSSWQDVTPEMAWQQLGNVSWKAARGDAEESFDSGFAVLLSSKKSQLQWSGSRAMGASINTTLFDPTLFTYIEQTHGTGGGIYFETYDITDECKVTRREGTTTMGRGASATITAVPEDGYRVKTIMVGGAELTNPKTYDVDTLTFTGGKYVDSANGLTIEKNNDGTYDVIFDDMQDPRHIHVDFTADYHFYKVWKGDKDPTRLNMTATPFAFVFQDVTLEDGKYTINGNTYSGPGGTFELKNNNFTVGEGTDNQITYFLEGNNLVTYKTDDQGNKTKNKTYPIRLDYVQNGDPVEFTVTKEDADDSSEGHVTMTTEDDYTVWRITYPSEGYKTKSGVKWPALPIETKPASHSVNHVERNYWFVTEEAPGWALVSYDNSKAEAPGKIEEATEREEVYKEGNAGDFSAWANASTKDYSQAEAVIRSAADNDHAYMSIFNTNDNNSYSWGGKIVNIPAVVVNVEKSWKDYSNAYSTRQDVWFHIDAQAEGEKITDFLPPQKLAGNASGGEDNSDGEENSKFTLTWGDKKAYGDDYLSDYEGTDYSKVKVVGKASDIPRTDGEDNPLYFVQDEKDTHKYLPVLFEKYDEETGEPVYSPNPDGITYYVNELEDKTAADKKYTFTIRETDAAGNELNKTSPTEFLYGYKSVVGDVAKDQDQATLDGVKVDSYTGKVTNTLETVDFTVKKVWADGNNADDKRPADGAVTYSIKKKSGTGDAATLASLPVAKSASQGTTDVTNDYKSGKITVKTDNGDTVSFSKLPKYDTQGQVITYTVEEAAISGYRTGIDGTMSGGYTVTNTQKTEVFVEKEWDDANNQDGVRPASVEFELLKDGADTGETVELSESTVWKGKFADLDKYDGDTLIVYSVKEVPFDAPYTDREYSVGDPTGTGTQSDPFKIKNSRTPETIDIKATKVWDDDEFNKDNKIGIRFDAVFKLMGDGVQVGDAKTVATGDVHDVNMTAEWTVDKYRNAGTPIVYKVVEDKSLTSPYSVNITGDLENGFTVTNYYPPEEIEYKTVTRTIVYTYLTEDGQTASATKVQTVRLKRAPTVLDLEGGVVEWTDWIVDDTYADNDQSAVTSPNGDDDENLKGWVADRNVPEWTIKYDSNGNPMDAYENVVYTPQPPTAKADVTYGAPGQPQTGSPTFTVTTPTTPNGSPNKIVKYELLDKEGNPATSVDAFDSTTGEKVGEYTLNEDGTITFTPSDPTYIGDPAPVKIKGTDSNGKSAETTYTPHIVDNTKTVKRTITYEYEDGTPVKDGEGNPLKLEQSATFTGTVNPKTGEVVFPDDAQDTLPQVDSDPIDGYTVDNDSIPKLVVTPKDNDIFEKVVYSPKGISAKPDETYGLRGQPQTGTPSFTMETPKLPDGSDNALTVKLIDPKTGEATNSKTVDALDKDGNTIGTYTLNDDGTVTFKPNNDFVGDPEPLKLEATDRLGKKATTTYTPHVKDPSITDTATRKIHYKYLNKKGEVVTGDTTQTVTLYKHAKSIDPKTGEVLEWGDWEPATFPAVKNPDDKVNGKIWFTGDSVDKLTVTKPGAVPDEYVIYKKIPYTVKYLDGGHGKSDRKGNQSGEDYGSDVTGGNGVKPDKGYRFTGRYTYVITDHEGNVIKTGETDDPESLDVIGNIEFTPIYKKLPTVIYVDPATGRIIQQTLPFLDENTEVPPPADPTREGYKFIGWNRFVEYDENGDIVNVRYEAIWEKVEESPKKSVDTGDTSNILMDVTILLSAALAVILMIRRRRNYNR